MNDPLSPDAVAQMVADLTEADKPLLDGVIPFSETRNRIRKSANMITTLAAENATLRADLRETALQYLSDAGQAMERIAALTEALKKLRDLMCEAFEDENGNSGCGMCADECTGCIAHAALTTDKEPKT